MKSGIYQIVHRESGRTYIGSSADIERRLRQHRAELERGVHDNMFLQRAWNKHGKDAFVFEPVETVPVEDLFEREQFWIDSTNCLFEYGGYNISPVAGGTRGMKQTPETLAKLSAIRKKLAATPEGRARLLAGIAKTKTPEVIAKMAATLKARAATPEGKKALQAFRDAKTPEGIARGAEKKRGYKPTQAACKKISARRKAFVSAMPPDQRSAMMDNVRENSLRVNRKLTFEDAEAIRAERKAGAKYRELEAKYGLSRVPLHKIVHGKTYLRPIDCQAKGPFP